MAKFNGNRAVTSIRLDPKNARIHDSESKAMIRASLEEVGAFRSIGVDGNGIVRAGNGVYEQAQNLGLKVRVVDAKPDELVAVRRADLKGEKAIRAALLDNRSGELSEWDPEMLGKLNAAGLLKGLSMEEFLKSVIPTETEDPPEAQIDKAGELQKQWRTQRGQIWEMASETVGGRMHRLLCGDATMEADHVLLIKDCKLDLTLTDPPYGVGTEYESTHDTAENIGKLIRQVMPLLLKHLPVLVSSGHTCMWEYPRPDWILAWIIPSGGGRNPWGFTCFHPILAYGKDPYLVQGLGGRPDTLVLVASDGQEFDHPVPKPPSVWKWFIERGTIKQGSTVFDPFCGSGTTVACCEQLGRICYGMEIEPKYVAVTLQRLADMGLKPRLADSTNKRAVA